MIYFLLFQLITFIFLVYFYTKRKYNFWSSVGVAGPLPNLFRLGNALQIGKNPQVMELELVRKYGKVYGIYSCLQPILTIADPELIKQVMVTDSAAFNNRRQLRVSTDLIHENIFFTDDACKWKRFRELTSQNFTTQKLKNMLPLMDRSVEKLVDYLNRVVKSTNGVIDTEAVIAGFTLDTFATTSLGSEITNIMERNVLLEKAAKLFDFSPITGICYFVMLKWVNRILNVKHIMNNDSFDYFEQMAREIVRQRLRSRSEEKLTKRDDLLDLLIDSLSNENEDENGIDNHDAKITLTESEMIAQTIAFLMAGFEKTASIISNTIFELATNLDIQERLASELTDSLQHLNVNSEQYYETVASKIPYLDAVIHESLRKYPIYYRLERRCVVDGYNLAGIQLQKDQLVEIAQYAIPNNAEYFPEPECFNPDRFMCEKKQFLVPNSFIPFGQGPRNCIGAGFAYKEMKLCLAKIVRQFIFRPTANTPIKLQLSNYKSTLAVKLFEIKVELRC